MAVLLASSTMVTSLIFYRSALNKEKLRLALIAQSQAHLIEAVARFDAIHSADFPGGSFEATLHQIRIARDHDEEFGTTGEFALARLEGEEMVFLLKHKHRKPGEPDYARVRMGSGDSVAMELALQGNSGTMLGRDYAGHYVLAAYEPIPTLGLGIVAKIDVIELEAPYLWLGAISTGISLLLAIGGTLLFVRFANPLARRVAESEKRYHNLIQNMGEGLAIADVNEIITFANPAFEKMLGVEQGTLAGRTLTEFLDEQGVKKSQQITESRKQGFSNTYEHKMLAANGELRDLIITGTPHYNADGSLHGGMGIVRDITDQKRTEDALKESEDRFQQLANNSHTVFWMMSSDYSKTIYISPAYEKIWGRSMQSLYDDPKGWIEAIHPDDQEQVMQELLADISTGGFKHEYRILRPDGSVRWVHDRAFPVFDELGNVYRIAGIAEDITDRKRAEVELSKLSRAIEQSQSTVVITDIGGKIEYVNPQFTIITGYSAEEALGQNPSIMKSGKHPPEFYAEMWTELNAGRVWRGEMINKKKSGEFYWESAVISPILNLEGNPTHFVAVKEDVTERRQAEDALQRERGYLQRAQELGQIGTWEIDVKENVLMWTDETYKVFGVPLGTPLTYEVFLNCIHPEDREEVNRIWDKALDKEPYDTEHRLLVNGEIKWVREKADLIFDENDECISAIGVAQDITDIKRAQQELRMLSTISEQAGEGMAVADFEGNMIFINSAWAEMHGYTKEELIGKHLSVFHSASQMTVIEAANKNVMQGVDFQGEVGHLHKDGTEFPTDMAVTQFKDEMGMVIGLIGLARNITERKQAEEDLLNLTESLESANEELVAVNEEMESTNLELYESHRKIESSMEELRVSQEIFRALSDNSPDVIMRFDSKYRFLYANPESARVSGVPQQNFIGKTHTELGFPREMVKYWDTAIQAVFDSDKPKHSQFTFKRKNISTEFDWHLLPEFDPDGTVVTVLSTARDITSLINIQHDLKKAQEKAEEASKAKGQFLANMSHELRTPLSVILGMTDVLIEKGYGSLTPKQDELLERIASNGQHLLSIINDLLDLAKVEAGKLEIRNAPMDIRNVVREACMLMRSQIEASGVALIEQGLDGKLPYTSDALRLKQVLLNLLSNAANFTSEGSITVYINITKEMVVVGVKDTGIGIDQSNLKRLFSPFEQVREAQKSSIKGTGLGLALCRELAHSLGGKIGVESTLGHGSNFHIELPIQKGKENNG